MTTKTDNPIPNSVGEKSANNWRFKPWNPGWPGRKPGSRNVETLFKDAIEKIWIDAKVDDVERDLIIKLLDMAKKGNIRAMDMWLDRCFGKVQQKIEANVSMNIEASKLKELPSDEISRFITSTIKGDD